MVLDSNVAAVILAGGEGSRLGVLSGSTRAKPAVNTHGIYRIIDFGLSNIGNTLIPDVYILTQYKPSSLNEHLRDQTVWGYDNVHSKIEVISMHRDETGIVQYNGDADAVRKELDRILGYHPESVLIIGGDHVYSEHFEDAINVHHNERRDLTIYTLPATRDGCEGFGVAKIDRQGNILDFKEKPLPGEDIEEYKIPPEIRKKFNIPGQFDYLVSMGVYIFDSNALKSELQDSSRVLFGNDVIRPMVSDNRKIRAHVFNGYWRDVGTIDSLFECNMEFLDFPQPFNLQEAGIHTVHRDVPPQVIHGTVSNSSIGGGSIISQGAELEYVITGYQVHVGSGSKLHMVQLQGATRDRLPLNRPPTHFTTEIGKNVRLRNVLLDKDCKVGNNVSIGFEDIPLDQRIKQFEDHGFVHFHAEQLGNGNKVYVGDFMITEKGRVVLGKGREIPNNFVG